MFAVLLRQAWRKFVSQHAGKHTYPRWQFLYAVTCKGICGTLIHKRKKPLNINGLFHILAERVGFEPTVPCSTPDFESGTFDHSATSPQRAA